METTQATIEPVTMSEVLILATWDRPRSNEELRDLLSQRESIVGLFKIHCFRVLKRVAKRGVLPLPFFVCPLPYCSGLV